MKCGKLDKIISFLTLGAIQITLDTLGGRGGVQDSLNKFHMGEGESKIGQKSIKYYLNGPLRSKLEGENDFMTTATSCDINI